MSIVCAKLGRSRMGTMACGERCEGGGGIGEGGMMFCLLVACLLLALLGSGNKQETSKLSAGMVRRPIAGSQTFSYARRSVRLVKLVRLTLYSHTPMT